MQSMEQWVNECAKGCLQAHIGLTLRGLTTSGLSTPLLVLVLQFLYGDETSRLLSCFSDAKVPNGLAICRAQGRLVLASHRLALRLHRQWDQAITSDLLAIHAVAKVPGDGGCIWLAGLCDFVLLARQEAENSGFPVN